MSSKDLEKIQRNIANIAKAALLYGNPVKHRAEDKSASSEDLEDLEDLDNRTI